MDNFVKILARVSRIKETNFNFEEVINKIIYERTFMDLAVSLIPHIIIALLKRFD